MQKKKLSGKEAVKLRQYEKRQGKAFINGKRFADEEKEAIESFGGNLPVLHHRKNATKPAGNGWNRMYSSGLSCISEQAVNLTCRLTPVLVFLWII